MSDQLRIGKSLCALETEREREIALPYNEIIIIGNVCTSFFVVSVILNFVFIPFGEIPRKIFLKTF